MTSEDPGSDSDRRDLLLLSVLSTQPYRKRVSLDPTVNINIICLFWTVSNDGGTSLIQE